MTENILSMYVTYQGSQWGSVAKTGVAWQRGYWTLGLGSVRQPVQTGC